MANLTVGLAKSVVEGTLSKAHAAIQEEAKLWQSAHRDLVFITGEFEMMRSFLDVPNAERGENPVVRTWVRQIRELAYDVEDCIELVVHLDKDKTSLWLRFRRLCLPWTPARMPALDEAVDEIEQLKARVVDVSTRNMRYSPGGQKLLPAAALGDTLAASNMLAEAREAVRKEQDLGSCDLCQQITKKVGDYQDLELQVISVWGSDGDRGTASIIMKAYHDYEICNNFSHRGWVKIVHPFSLHDLVRNLMLQFCPAEQEGMDVLTTMMQATAEDLFNAFKRIVTEKRYLVVLEGLSNMAEWHALRKFLPDKRKGSLIIVSTEQPEIASLCVGQSYRIIELKQFSAEHSVCAFFDKGSFGERHKGSDGKKQKQRDKGEKPFVKDFNHDRYLHRIEGSNGGGDKGKKSVDEDSFLVGRELEIKQLLSYPAKARMNKNGNVMSVWGIAGVGKSALVKEFFDDIRRDPATSQFENFYWVNVSHPFNLRDFHWSIPLDFRLETLRCLIVIDDIRSKQEWDLIQTSLMPRSSKSVIIAITTEASIAANCSNDENLVFNVKGLEAAAAYRLFCKEVSKKNVSYAGDPEDFQVRELILKCGGLPKVIVAVAGELAKLPIRMLDGVVSLNGAFMHHLETNPSYDSLRDLLGWMDSSYFRTCPDSLKPCIFYLSIFPRDHPIRRRRLVRRFIAEGYTRDDDKESAEEIGEKQFSQLLDLSVVQKAPHLFTNSLNTRLVCFHVNGFIRECIIPRRKQENLVLELDGNCALTTQRTGRHLVILDNWNRDRILFESIDFSRLRSLTVFGSWKKFLLSEHMKLLRVLDLEDARGVRYEDLEYIVKWLRRLKFLSLRGQRDIHHLPGNMDNLRQLQTLDIRGTSIVILPENVIKLDKLQYVRGGTSNFATSTTPSASSWLPQFLRWHRRVGIMVPTGIQKLTSLHTLGIVNVADSGGKDMLKVMNKLSQLRKLGVSGINMKNIKDFSNAIRDHVNLESLSVHIDKDNQGCLDIVPLPLGILRSLKLYGINDSLPQGSEQLIMLRKLDLEMQTLTQNDIRLLAVLPELCILRLRIKQRNIHFIAEMERTELSTFNMVKILEISSSSGSLSVEFGSSTMKNLELLKLDCSSGTSYNISAGLDDLSELREVLLTDSSDKTFITALETQLHHHPKKPVLRLQ